mmetsp:Transcript_1132/g.1538  ORF Transcript_1132/g.1538 Transcript_1132/m.1538 type:complete len:216 (+) Transcript_1132:472-1119(+)
MVASSEAFMSLSKTCSFSQSQHSVIMLSSKSSHENPTNTDLSSSRRNFVLSSSTVSLLAGLSLNLANTILFPSEANAAYGTSSKLELPNYIEFLIEKNSSIDQEKILYKGSDVSVQLKRLSDAANRLSEIPKLAQEKKWSQVQGILTGPLGTLGQTMNYLSKDLPSSNDAKKVSNKVKQNILMISQEASKKNVDGCIKATEDATRDLEAFVKLVF